MEQIKVVVMPGNNYNKSQLKPFINLIRDQPWCKSVIWIDLLENSFSHLSYSQLEPLNYNRYIERFLLPGEKYLFYGCSMGCYHIQNFISKKPEYAAGVVWLEPTMCGGDYDKLYYFEEGRGNGDLMRYFRESADDESLSSADKVIDIAVSRDFTNPMPRWVPLSIILTTLDNEGKPYTPEQIDAKNRFVAKMAKQVVILKEYLLDTMHTCDITGSDEIKKIIIQIMGNTIGCNPAPH